MASAAGAWTTAKAQDGQVYYYNTETKETTWAKPEALLSVADRILLKQPWKSSKAEDGREYYYNSETRATVWDMPEAYKAALAEAERAEAASRPQMPEPSLPSRPPAQAAGNRYPDRDDYDRRDRDRRNDYAQTDSIRNTFVPAAAAPNDPEYATREEAEAAFAKLLKRTNVQADWSWEETMRTTIKDPQFRAIKDPKDRRAAWEKFRVEMQLADKEKEKERAAKLRQDFVTMLKSHPEIKHYTRWRTARPNIEGETIFRSASDDTERRQLFEEYVASLRKAKEEARIANERAAKTDLVNMLHTLKIEPYTRWSEARALIEENERYQQDDKFRSLPMHEVLIAYENHVKALERDFNDQRQLQKTQKARRERTNREGFIGLLKELQASGKFKAGMKWKELHPLIEDDPRYDVMMGQEGSTPLDLFWDALEDLERDLRVKRNTVLDILDDQQFEMTLQTKLEEFSSIVRPDARSHDITDHELHLIFDRLHEKVVKRAEEDKYEAERRQRKNVDALRSVIKHLEPPIRANDTWEHVKPLIKHYKEYDMVRSDELRRSAFDKVIQRLKEKDAEREQARTRRDHDRDREREREGRNGHRRRDDRGYSRTPEMDVYEADRRRAVADRERKNRQPSIAGLSPPPSVHDRRRRESRDMSLDHQRSRGYSDRDYDRDDRRDRGRLAASPYDRERRTREVERERAYMSRADPREVVAKALDYGESGSAGSMADRTESSRSRKNARGSEAPSVGRDSKRRKVEEDKASVDVEMMSGSEEGEIEEVEVKVDTKDGKTESVT